MNTPENSPDPAPGGTEIGRALLLLFGGTGILAVLQGLWPPVAGWLQAMLAGLLFVVPWWVLRGRDVAMDDLGVDTGTWRSTLAWSMGTMAVIFPLFCLGHHGVMTGIMGREIQLSGDRLSRWDQELEGSPHRSCEARDELLAFTDPKGLWILGPTSESVELRGIWKQGRRVVCESGKLPVASSPRRADRDGILRLGPGEGILLGLDGREDLALEVWAGDAPLEAKRILRGTYRQEAGADGSLSGHRGLGWLIPFVIVQLGLVALPEEWFFRGYLQGRMDQRWGKPWRVLGAQIGPGLFVAALAFALLHPILIPGLHRLLVFFPALLFGWLKARNGHIGAAMVVHAGSNLLLEILTGLYL